MTKLTMKTVGLAMANCASNAYDLASDADLLRDHKRNARAFLLYNSAIEEFAKYFMLEIVGRKLASRTEINWSRFWQRLRAHDAKMAQAAARIESFGHLLDDEEFDLARAGILIWRQVGTKARNSALYVEVEGRNVRGPADIDWEPGLKALKGSIHALVAVSRVTGTTEAEIAAAFAAKSASDPIAAFASEVERLKAAGVTAHQIDTLINQAWHLTSPRKAAPET